MRRSTSRKKALGKSGRKEKKRTTKQQGGQTQLQWQLGAPLGDMKEQTRDTTSCEKSSYVVSMSQKQVDGTQLVSQAITLIYL